MSETMTAAERKQRPMATGVLDYFGDALMEVAHCSFVGNEQHNPGQPLHWAKEKSTDHADALMRHLKDRGTIDTDGVRHSAKVAWRALANLQVEIDRERALADKEPAVRDDGTKAEPAKPENPLDNPADYFAALRDFAQQFPQPVQKVPLWWLNDMVPYPDRGIVVPLVPKGRPRTCYCHELPVGVTCSHCAVDTRL